MKIAVIGASGMLGTRMVEVLESNGHEALTADLPVLDITDPAMLARFFATQDFDGLINCAAFTAVDACEVRAQRPTVMKVNGEAVGNMANLCREARRWMIHISTDYVFNGRGERPWKEVDAPDPVNAYGRSKLEGERLFHLAGDPGWIVRTSWLYGPKGKNFVRAMAGLLRTKSQVEVVDDQTGGPTFTGDLANFLLKMAEAQPPMGTYHYANEGHVTWCGFTRAIKEELGLTSCEVVPVTSDRFPRPARRPANSRFDLSKARAFFPKGMRPWREALREYLAMEKL